MSSAPLSDPITWVSDDPHLSGVFAPVGPEIEATDLTVLSGAIPADLKGAYIRNGPNPRFQPLSYTYPLEGDGMLHAVARQSRFSYVPTLTATAGLEQPASATFNCLVQVDAETGTTRRHDFGRGLIGEAAFIPRGAGETDGWLATYVYNADEATSDLALLDAAAPDAAPVAVIRMPQRVPAGLHGIWVPG